MHHNIWLNLLHLTKIVYFCEKNGGKILLRARSYLWCAIYSELEQNNSSFIWLRFSKIIKKNSKLNKKQKNNEIYCEFWSSIVEIKWTIETS